VQGTEKMMVHLAEVQTKIKLQIYQYERFVYFQKCLSEFFFKANYKFAAAFFNAVFSICKYFIADICGVSVCFNYNREWRKANQKGEKRRGKRGMGGKRSHCPQVSDR
jgi:hypothetical protein